MHDLWMNYVSMNKCKYPKYSWTWAENMCINLWLSKVGVFESMINLEHLNLWIYKLVNMRNLRNLEPKNFENQKTWEILNILNEFMNKKFENQI